MTTILKFSGSGVGTKYTCPASTVAKIIFDASTGGFHSDFANRLANTNASIKAGTRAILANSAENIATWMVLGRPTSGILTGGGYSPFLTPITSSDASTDFNAGKLSTSFAEGGVDLNDIYLITGETVVMAGISTTYSFTVIEEAV